MPCSSMYSFSILRNSAEWLTTQCSRPTTMESTPTVNLWVRIWMAATTAVEKTPMTYMPAPMARPIPAVAQMPAAVVRPLMELPLRKMMPAPRKETPLMIWAASRAGSVPLVP